MSNISKYFSSFGHALAMLMVILMVDDPLQQAYGSLVFAFSFFVHRWVSKNTDKLQADLLPGGVTFIPSGCQVCERKRLGHVMSAGTDADEFIDGLRVVFNVPPEGDLGDIVRAAEAQHGFMGGYLVETIFDYMQHNHKTGHVYQDNVLRLPVAFYPHTSAIREMLAIIRPEIGWPAVVMQAMCDISRICELIENGGDRTIANAESEFEAAKEQILWFPDLPNDRARDERVIRETVNFMIYRR